MPRGLTILRNDTVVYGMNKAFDFSVTSLPRTEAGGRILRALAAGSPDGPAPLQVGANVCNRTLASAEVSRHTFRCTS